LRFSLLGEMHAEARAVAAVSLALQLGTP
jgi:hypothetical protein